VDPRFAGSIPTEGDGFLRVIKIRSATSFGGEVKPSVPCRRFKNLTGMNRTSNVRKVNSSGHFSPKSPDCLPDGSGSHIRMEQKLVRSVSRSLTTECTLTD
jgi:hypothetical protein